MRQCLGVLFPERPTWVKGPQENARNGKKKKSSLCHYRIIPLIEEMLKMNYINLFLQI